MSVFHGLPIASPSPVGWRNEKHRRQWASTLRDHVRPPIGAVDVCKADTASALKALQPIRATQTETATFVFRATIAGMRKHFSETTSHRRLMYALAAGVATALLPLPLTMQARSLLGWCVGTGCYLVLAWWLAVEFDANRTRERAQAQDQSSMIVFLLMLLVALASVAAIVLMLQSVKGLSTAQRTGHLVLAMTALACSWLLVHTIFAFRYAHRYYQELLEPGPNGGGLEFPGQLEPDYFDFMYCAYVVGMTSQVSDVQVTSREMRRLTLIHSVTSFAFNMVVLALSINVIAGAIQ